MNLDGKSHISDNKLANASHWCKSVIEEVVQPVELPTNAPWSHPLPPRPPQSGIQSLASSSNPAEKQQLYSQALNNSLYRDYQQKQLQQQQYYQYYQQTGYYPPDPNPYYATQQQQPPSTYNPYPYGAQYPGHPIHSHPQYSQYPHSGEIPALASEPHSSTNISSQTPKTPIHQPLTQANTTGIPSIPTKITTATNVQTFNPPIPIVITKTPTSVFSSPAVITASNPLNTVSTPAPAVKPQQQKTAATGPQDAPMPPNLKKYIEHSFSRCQTQEDRQFVTDRLKDIIAKVSNDGRIVIHKWDLEPYPALPSAAPVETPKEIQSTPQEPSTPTAETEKSNKKRKSRFGEKSTTDLDSSFIPLTNTFSTPSSSSSSVTVSSAIVIPSQGPNSAELKMREMRANRFNEVPLSKPAEEKGLASNRKGKKAHQHLKAPISTANIEVLTLNGSGESYSEIEIEKLKVIGTSERLEKDYFRLTSAPDPATVRPEHILKKAITALKRKWRNNEVEYLYICSQLKAIRQDLTVQHLRNEFTVDVYEIHARISLECGDLNEYNQCQTQLKHLYDSGLTGSDMEFMAYRILYYVYLQGNRKYQSGSSDIAYILSNLKPEALSNDAVSHALQVRESLRREYYHKFFQLYKSTPNMGNYIIDLMMDNVRLQMLMRMCKAYKPNISLDFVINELAFESDEIGESFLLKAGCILVTEDDKDRVINTKDTVINAAGVFTQDKLLL